LNFCFWMCRWASFEHSPRNSKDGLLRWLQRETVKASRPRVLHQSYE
jgi:hypothetical protein